MKKTEFFDVVSLHRDDIRDLNLLTDKAVDELTDSQMKLIARKLGDALYDSQALREVVEVWLETKE